jgi:enoyl-CoA hydratase/carnithine racemase
MAVNTRREGGTVTLELARPERGNALGEALVEALLEQVRAALADDGVHTLVLRGQGRHFCTGLDLSDLESSTDAQWLHRLVRIETLLATVWSAPKRTVAVAQGRTWGAGADLFAACEVRVAQPGTTFRFPGARFGIVLGTRRLAARIGEVRARRLVTEGGELDAQQALQCGLADANEESVLPEPVVGLATAAAIRAATRATEQAVLCADLAALVRSAAEPGLRARLAAYVATLQRAATA